jgi:transcriptional regulator with XRE-family HTH domain
LTTYADGTYDRMSSIMDIDFPQWLEEERAKRNWSQADLSRHAGISRQVVSDYEGRKRKYFDEGILTKIAHAFKYPPEIVFRAAGLLPTNPDEDPWVEEMIYKLSQIPPELRPMAGRLINGLVEEDQGAKKPTARKAKPVKGSAS